MRVVVQMEMMTLLILAMILTSALTRKK